MIDEALRDYETVSAAAGTPRTVMPLTLGELVTLVGGALHRVSRDSHEDPARHAAATEEDQLQHAAGLGTTMEIR